VAGQIEYGPTLAPESLLGLEQQYPIAKALDRRFRDKDRLGLCVPVRRLRDQGGDRRETEG